MDIPSSGKVPKDGKTSADSLPSAGAKKVHAKRKSSIVVQFSVKLALLIFVMFMALGVISYKSVLKGTNESYTGNMTGIVPVYAESVSLWTKQFVRELRMYTGADVTKTGDQAAVIAWMRNIKDRRSSDFASIFFCGADGMSHSDTGQDIDLSDRGYFKAVMQEGKDIFISNPVKSRLDNSMIYTVCVAAYTSANQKIGFFAGVVTLKHLQEMIAGASIGKAGYLFVVDGDGVIMAHPDDSAMLKDLAKEESIGMKDVVADMIKGNTGSAKIVDIRRNPATVFYAPVPDTLWSVAAVVPEAQISRVAVTLGKTIAVECLLFAVILVLAGGAMIMMALKPLKKVETAIQNIASGNADLTQRLQHTVNNEIGSVVAGFNNFVEKLHGIISDVKKSEGELSVSGGDLRGSIEDSSSAITQILSDIDSVNKEITNQSASVEETAGAITEISQNIVSLEKMIENQASGITEASASVEQMIGNIGGVNQSVEKMAASFDSLEKRSRDGMSKQENVSEQIKLISSQSEMLEDANAAIASIASQTNLLAMNAAIEAAHAGEAGKGFSVVADEIRKLSETSTSQSKTIGDELKKIRDSIGTVVTASAETTSAFSAVSESIKETDMLVLQIKSAMEEQLSGSKQIGQALHMMNDSTAEVRTASNEMTAGQKAILDEVKRLQDATGSMKDKVAEMAQGARKISDAGTSLNNISKSVNGSIQRISGQIDQFKV